MRPVLGRVSQPFADPGSYASMSDSHGPRGHHTGIDFAHVVPGQSFEGAVIRAILPGEVVIDEYNSTMGNWLGIYNHDMDLLVTYWHMQARSSFDRGDWVQVFAPVGKVGSTGNSTAPHLHLQVNKGSGFDYHGHIDPVWATKVYTRLRARTLYRKSPRHPNAA